MGKLWEEINNYARRCLVVVLILLILLAIYDWMVMRQRLKKLKRVFWLLRILKPDVRRSDRRIRKLVALI